ncbi:MAG TPA: A/G-specific adenine glycosylase [Candidatus Nitrosotenuis sp.]|nr:A/G-specific adenine glycosylase [Candidatus Nitrosotenuis sp.]
MILTKAEIADFQEEVWSQAHALARPMSWREDISPYRVLVSELMLQQTQVPRVIPKFESFMQRFPDVATLAHAPLGDVLSEWSGLGYNRRAKFLHNAAKQIVGSSGHMPETVGELVKLPGVGANTAAAIMNYAYNIPTSYVETNIRTIYFHHFFPQAEGDIDDATLCEYVDMTLDREHPREWFWALMDYGTHLKKTAGGRLSTSKHYKKQSPLKGSLREMRGCIISRLSTKPHAVEALREAVEADERFTVALRDLAQEGMIENKNDTWSLTGHGLPS